MPPLQAEEMSSRLAIGRAVALAALALLALATAPPYCTAQARLIEAPAELACLVEAVVPYEVRVLRDCQLWVCWPEALELIAPAEFRGLPWAYARLGANQTLELAFRAPDASAELSIVAIAMDAEGHVEWRLTRLYVACPYDYASVLRERERLADSIAVLRAELEMLKEELREARAMGLSQVAALCLLCATAGFALARVRPWDRLLGRQNQRLVDRARSSLRAEGLEEPPDLADRVSELEKLGRARGLKGRGLELFVGSELIRALRREKAGA